MNEYHLRAMSEDENGWIEVCLIVKQMTQIGTSYEPSIDDDAEGETVGYVRVVEGTEDGPHTWWDAKVVEDGQVLNRRFTSLDTAMLTLAARNVSPETVGF